MIFLVHGGDEGNEDGDGKLKHRQYWIWYPVPQPYCSLAFSGGYVRRMWLKVALLDPIDLWTTISISKTF